MVEISIDPFFFYVALVDDGLNWLSIDKNLATVVTVLRSLIDIFYLVHMVFQFRINFISPSMVFGKRELVIDPIQIVKRLEERRVNRIDTEVWMRHCSLPKDLRDHVRRHDQYKWLSNQRCWWRAVNSKPSKRSQAWKQVTSLFRLS